MIDPTEDIVEDEASLLPEVSAVELCEALREQLISIKQSWPEFQSPSLREDLLKSRDDSAPVPPDRNRRRISGDRQTEEAEFLESGASDVWRMFNILNGVQWGKDPRVLDWGVGCGRMARHLPFFCRQNFIGVDVDPQNIEWCNANMLFGRYSVVIPSGELPVESKSVDLIYGCSVMTHLSECEQFHWLKELARVVHPDGAMLLSVHGLYAAAQSEWFSHPDCVLDWLHNGFRDAGSPNLDIANVVPSGYYRDTAHTPCYIRDFWSDFVEVMDIIPGAWGGPQDVVVCRAKT